MGSCSGPDRSILQARLPPTEIGGVQWDAAWSAVLGDGVATNIPGCPRASAPFDLNDYRDYRTLRLEADLDATGSEWVGITFLDTALKGLAQGQLFALIRGTDGGLRIRADGGGDNTLLYWSAGEPCGLPGLNHLELAYDRVDSSVAVRLNGCEIPLNISSLGSFVPDIQHAGYQGQITGCYTAADQMIVDDLIVAMDDPLAPLTIAELPAFRYAAPGSTVTLSCLASGGFEPNSVQWQASDDGVSFSDLSDGGRLNGVTTAALQINQVEASNGRFYRCTVTGSNQPQPRTSSNASLLQVITQVAACSPTLPQPADFTTKAGFDEWSLSSEAAMAIWQYGSTYARMISNGCDYLDRCGGIERRAVPISVSAAVLRLTFPFVEYNPQARLSWGEELEHSYSFAVWDTDTVQPRVVEIDLRTLPDWHDGSGVAGFYLRDLRLEIKSNGIASHLSAIEALPGPDFEFAEPPVLTIDGDVPQSYGAGGTLTLSADLCVPGAAVSDANETAQLEVSERRVLDSDSSTLEWTSYDQGSSAGFNLGYWLDVGDSTWSPIICEGDLAPDCSSYPAVASLHSFYTSSSVTSVIRHGVADNTGSGTWQGMAARDDQTIYRYSLGRSIIEWRDKGDCDVTRAEVKEIPSKVP